MNFDKYIGLPYQENGRDWQGVDCWGLARLFYKHELDIELPDYSELYSGSWDEQVTKLLSLHKDSWNKVETPVPGDLCLFNIYGEPAHVGVYIGENKFLHSRDQQDSVVESLTSVQWKKRLDGFFRYSTKKHSVQVTGAPHPLKIAHFYEYTYAGTTVASLVEFITKKYRIGKYLSTRIVIMLDGVPVPKELWDTTLLKEGQSVTYRTLAQGRNATRLLLTIAVIVASFYTYGATLELLPATLGAPTAGLKALAIAASAAVQMAGMALIDKVAPIRMPTQNDPGQPNQLGLFNGSSNQANRLGAIPVVMGKMRYVGLLGATPYIETLTNSNILNLLIIWGFGPLNVSNIQVGANDLVEYYYKDLPMDVARPVTLYGTKDETAEQVEKFNQLYPNDVEQVFSQQGELTNNQTDGNPWREVTFVQQATGIDIALTFPEGMRAIKTDSGEVLQSTTSVEIQIAKTTGSFDDVPSIRLGNGNTSAAAFTTQLTAPTIYVDQESGQSFPPLYRWYVLATAPDNQIYALPGAVTDSQYAEPSENLKSYFTRQSYEYLVGREGTYKRIPDIPEGFTKLYTVCLQQGIGLLPAATQDHRAGASVLGLTLSYDNGSTGDFDGTYYNGFTTVSITGGTFISGTSPTNGEPVVEDIFTTSLSSVPGAVAANPDGSSSEFLKTHGIWVGTGSTASFTKTITLTKDGVYSFEASVDDTATISFGGTLILDIPRESFKSTLIANEYFKAGTYTLVVNANDTGGKRAFALKITYSANGGANAPAGPRTIVTFGTPQLFYKRKDPFNWVYRVRGLDRAVYKLRVRRADPERTQQQEDESKERHYNKVALSSATCYDNTLPTQNPPRGKLAKTAIKVQSTSKANGQVDGVNALVETLFYDWDRATNGWTYRATNNPASLFIYILTHPANAYRVADWDSATFGADVAQKIDLDKIVEWHNFCNPETPTDNNPILTYNEVLTSTRSVMDVLRDICAAGKASPVFIDGKWSVVIDKPRTHVVQHFTPHNSWGFEATKTLPRLPHAFRVTIQDEENAYQAKELYAYNYGYSQYGTEPGKKAAEIFEELSLPGVTNSRQALHLARWHLAQLKLRPETYTINTDFEYLVCTRGDLVRVTHDVPLWGSGSGRIKSVNAATKTLVLTEDVLLEAGKQYRILVRNNNLTNVAGSGSVYKTIAAITQTDYYDTLTVVESISGTEIEVDNLFMIGELNKETQELVVINIEPTGNLSARITLVDYSPQIYTADLANDLLVFDPNITKPNTGAIENTILQSPTITGVTSTRETSQQVAVGSWQTSALVSFSNAANLSKHAKLVQLQLIRGDQDFSSADPSAVQTVNKETGNYAFVGLETGIIYKVRARYTNTENTIFGPWSEQAVFVAGAAGLLPKALTLSMDLEGTYIVAKPPQDLYLPNDFKTYEYRLLPNDTGTEDFWELVPDEINKIKVTQSLVEGRFNLMDLPAPRLSEAGITYRVACRMVNRTNDYSSTSALGTIVVTTIRY